MAVDSVRDIREQRNCKRGPGMRYYKFKCNVPLWQTFFTTLACAVVIVFTFGLALPYCLVMVLELVLNNTEVEQLN